MHLKLKALIKVLGLATIVQVGPVQAQHDEQSVQQLIQQVRAQGHYSCAECHGADGNPSITDKYAKQSPILAGQYKGYLLAQLGHFKAARRYTDEMGKMLEDYSGAELEQIAEYFSQQITYSGPVDPTIDTLQHTAAEDARWVEQGQQLYLRGDPARSIAACSSCHGEAGEGDGPKLIPKVAGQHARYTRMTLQAYRAGSRTTDQAQGSPMATATSALSDADIRDLAAYLQSVR